MRLFIEKARSVLHIVVMFLMTFVDRFQRECVDHVSLALIDSAFRLRFDCNLRSFEIVLMIYYGKLQTILLQKKINCRQTKLLKNLLRQFIALVLELQYYPNMHKKNVPIDDSILRN